MTEKRQFKARHTTPHSEASKKRISNSQKKRYDLIRDIVNKKPLTEERVRKLISEVLDDFLKNKTNNIKNNNHET